MFKCKICGETFEKKGQIGYHIASVHGSLTQVNKNIESKCRETYAERPKRCKYCGTPISYEKRHENDFCNHSCAASFSNMRRPKKEKIKGKTPKERYDEIFNPIIQNWIEGKEVPEMSCRGGITSGDLKGSYKRRIKEFLLDFQNHKCSICGQEDRWNNLPFTMILDHINGDPANHLRSNLRLICPICDTQLPTPGSKNRGHGRHSGRMSRAKQKKEVLELIQQKDSLN